MSTPLSEPSTHTAYASATRPPRTHNPWTRERLGQLARDAAYLLLSWPLLLTGFIVTITLVALGVGLSIIWVGLPILVAGLSVARGFATIERRAGAALTGRPVTEGHYASEGTGLKRILRPITDPQSWLDVLWLFVGLIVSCLTWSLALTWLVGAAATVLAPVSTLVVSGVLPNEDVNGLGELLGVPFPLMFDVVSQFVVGLGFALTAPWVLRGLSTLQSGLADLVLNTRSRHQAEVSQLSESRAAVRQAETTALRRLERDIHDGPQQRLVRLQMDLARARRQAGNNPELADQLIGEAMAQTQETLAELRALSRGIAPPVLVDRGLEAAITEAAGRSTVPVTVFVDLPEGDQRLPVHVETAAYFVVSEALTNINKHSQATSAQVVAGVQDAWLFLTITDNGIGGADLAKGHGLAGLVERLRGVDGTLTLDSPQGGPTSLEVVIACGS